VDGDGTQLRQLVMNLITNASDALGSEAGALEVRTRTLDEPQLWEPGSSPEAEIPDGPVVMLEISDTGCGMNPSTLSRIFDPFFTTKFTGRGLGLAAALGIVRGHRGRIDVRSEPGDGTCFRVLLPASEQKLLPTVRSAAPSVRPRAARGTILVADDEEVVRSMARRILEQAGFDVLTAADGRDAIDCFRECAAEVSAVLLDLTMPRLGGEEALRVLRQIRPEVRVVITSGYSESDIVSRFQGQELDGFLQKPFRPADLVERIVQALEERRTP
jgi:CheY-like chemotaxis protein